MTEQIEAENALRELHRPDGEVVRIDRVRHERYKDRRKRAQAKIQLLNGSIDVLENVDEVTQIISSDDALPSHGSPNGKASLSETHARIYR